MDKSNEKLILFNDSHQSDGFEEAVEAISGLLKEAKLAAHITTSFIEDYCSDEGEFAWKIRLEVDYLYKEETND